MASAFVVDEKHISNRLKSNVTIHFDGKQLNVVALWDTGATNSCISRSVATTLSLVSNGSMPILTPSGDITVNTYLVDVTLPNDVYIPDIMVCDSEIDNQGIGMLIGMDIITKGDFAVSNYNGKTVFSFRMPSESRLDFVSGIKMSNLIMAKRTSSTGFSKKMKKRK